MDHASRLPSASAGGANPVAEPARAIIARSAERHGVSVEELLGPSRAKHIVAARWEAIRAVAGAHPKYSTTKLGEIFNRDHSSILYALGRIAGKGPRR